jgi:hypothetical protein
MRHAINVTNQTKDMAQRSELYPLRLAHGIYSNFNASPHTWER